MVDIYTAPWTDGYRAIYSYDAANNLVQTTRYNSDGGISSWIEYGYDAAGNLLREIYYQEDGSIPTWTEYIYAPFSAR